MNVIRKEGYITSAHERVKDVNAGNIKPAADIGSQSGEAGEAFTRPVVEKRRGADEKGGRNALGFVQKTGKVFCHGLGSGSPERINGAGAEGETGANAGHKPGLVFTFEAILNLRHGLASGAEIIERGRRKFVKAFLGSLEGESAHESARGNVVIDSERDGVAEKEPRIRMIASHILMHSSFDSAVRHELGGFGDMQRLGEGGKVAERR